MPKNFPRRSGLGIGLNAGYVCLHPNHHAYLGQGTYTALLVTLLAVIGQGSVIPLRLGREFRLGQNNSPPKV